jgi:hypothetical protein
MTTTTKTVRDALADTADGVSKTKSGTYVARRGFFYRHGYGKDKFCQAVTAALTRAGVDHEIVDSYEKWTAFRCGASLASSSHWGVEFRVHEDPMAAVVR